MRGRAVAAVKEKAASSGVDGGRGNQLKQRSRERQHLESFRMKSETARDGLLFIVLKISIVLEFGSKWFWFKTVANEDIIKSDFKLELLLIS
jgi:hypothetical protein